METEKIKNPEKVGNLKKVDSTLETILFSSKWLLIPFYFGLIIALAIFAFVDIKTVSHMLYHIKGITEEDGMMMILKLIDLTMVANLVKLIIIGSYTSFFKKNINDNSTDPNLNTSSGVLKVKMATALIGVTSISLLQTFVKAGDIDGATLERQLIIHATFLIGALILAAIDMLHVKSVAVHHEDCCKHNIKD